MCTRVILALLIGIFFMGSGDLSAQTGDGVTPAGEDVCDELLSATPGLYGLCVAFCEAQDCEPDFQAADPFAECRPSNPRLLRVYDRKKGPTDPDMPCMQAGCPCFSEEELLGMGTPYDLCAIECDDMGSNREKSCMRNGQTLEAAEVTINLAGRYGCTYHDGLTRINLRISEEEFQTCKEMLTAFVDTYNYNCTVFEDNR